VKRTNPLTIKGLVRFTRGMARVGNPPPTR
jgi:hypothetical protein